MHVVVFCQTKVASYGKDRRHAEIPKNFLQYFGIGDEIAILPAAELKRLMKKAGSA